MIYWDLILQTDDIKGHLARMYESMTLGQLAEHLGVSPSALRSKMESLGVERRPRGGSHKRLAYADLPNGIEDMTPEEIVSAARSGVGRGLLAFRADRRIP